MIRELVLAVVLLTALPGCVAMAVGAAAKTTTAVVTAPVKAGVDVLTESDEERRKKEKREARKAKREARKAEKEASAETE